LAADGLTECLASGGIGVGDLKFQTADIFRPFPDLSFQSRAVCEIGLGYY
jgi:hypothetical protein